MGRGENTSERRSVRLDGSVWNTATVRNSYEIRDRSPVRQETVERRNVPTEILYRRRVLYVSPAGFSTFVDATKNVRLTASSDVNGVARAGKYTREFTRSSYTRARVCVCTHNIVHIYEGGNH